MRTVPSGAAFTSPRHDREIVGAIAAALEKEGWRVLRAYDGIEALDKALDPKLRLILMDVMMPKLDGLSAVLRIRERRNLPRLRMSRSTIPVSMLVSFTASPSAVRARAAGS